MSVNAIATIKLTEGDTARLTVTVRDAAGAVVDLTGATAIAWQMARSAFAASPTLSKSLGSGVTVTDAMNGVFQVALAPADSADLLGDFHHEAEVTDGAGDIATVFCGTLNFSKGLI